MRTAADRSDRDDVHGVEMAAAYVRFPPPPPPPGVGMVGYDPYHYTTQTFRRQSQQSYRIRSRRALRYAVGREYAMRAMENKIKETALRYTSSRTCMLFLAIATLSSCLFYIAGTYLGGKAWVETLETGYGVVFLVDYVLSVAAAPVPLNYALSKGGLADLVSCLPAFGSFAPWMTSLAFVRYLRVGKAIRVMRNHKLLSSVFSNDDVTIKATLLIVKVVGVVMMTSAILYGMERGLKDDGGTESFNEPGWQWHDALYFTIVTLSTVGYGDVLPISDLSRLLMVVVIVFALTYVPLEVGKLVDAINARPKNRKGFSRSLVGKQIHVILAMPGGGGSRGGVANDGLAGGEFDCDTLERCVSEFFDEDQDTSNVLVWVLVMSPCAPSADISTLCRSPKFRSRVVYFRGSVTNPRDMSIVCAEYADCIFLSPSAVVDGDIRAAQERTHLAAKAIRRYLDRTPTDEVLMEKVRRLSQTGNPRRTVVTVEELHSKDHLIGFGIDHVICRNEMKMAMLASATLCPAFLPFVANCVRSCAGYEPNSGSRAGKERHTGDRKGKTKKKAHKSDDGGEAWLEDYSKGATYEMYSIPLDVIAEDSSLWDMTFKSAARKMYDESKGTVLLLAAVESTDAAAFSMLQFGGRRRRQHHQHRHRWGADPGLSGGGSGSGAAGASAAGRGGSGGGNSRPGRRQVQEASVMVDVFPDETFRFTIDSHLLVLAESQTSAEDLIFNFQVGSMRGVDGRGEEEMGASVSDKFFGTKREHGRRNVAGGATATIGGESRGSRPSASRAPAAEFPVKVKPTKDSTATAAGTATATAAAASATSAPASATAAAATAAAAASSAAATAAGASSRAVVVKPATAESVGGNTSYYTSSVPSTSTSSSPAAAATSLSATTTTTTTAASTNASVTTYCSATAESVYDMAGQAPARVPVPGLSAVVAAAAAAARPARRGSGRNLGVGPSSGVDVGAGAGVTPLSSAPVSAVRERERERRRKPPSVRTLTELAAADFNSPASLAESTASRPRLSTLNGGPGSVARMDEETKEQLGTLQKEIFEEDEIDWTHALGALKRARAQLRELDIDGKEGEQDPPAFFDKVVAISNDISEALRLHTSSVPPGLKGHIVLVGDRARLQHYIFALRRQRPHKPIVVVTEDKESFFQLRERLVECKFDEMSLNITKIYHVFGRTQDKLTLEEARVAQAESVMLLSVRGDDTTVLLASFELEQVLEEIPMGQPRPKVLLDLSKDNSIYYSGVILGGVEETFPYLASTRFGDESSLAGEPSSQDVRHWPLFAAGRVWTTSIMDVFAVRTYFNAHVLSFFETVLHIHPRQTMTAQQLEHEKEQKEQKLQRKQQQRQRQQEHQEQRRRKMQQQWQRQLRASGGVKTQQAGGGGGSGGDGEGGGGGHGGTVSDPQAGDTKEDMEVSGGVGGGRRSFNGANGRGSDRTGGGGDDDYSSNDDDDDDDDENDDDPDGDGSGSGGGGTESDGKQRQGTRKGRGRGGRNKSQGSTTTTTRSECDFGDSAANDGRCQFAQLRVAASFAGKTYGYLVRHLISKGAVPLGLYRPSGTKGSTLSYTHINPAPDEPLRAWPQASEAAGERWGFHTGGGATSTWEQGERGLADSVGGDDETGEGLFSRRGSIAGGGGGGGGAVWAKVEPKEYPARGGVGGDEVFVIRSRKCPLTKEVSLD